MRVKNIIGIVALIAAARLLVLGGPVLLEPAVAAVSELFCAANLCWDRVTPPYKDSDNTQPTVPPPNGNDRNLINALTFADIDGDGDKDLFMGIETLCNPQPVLPAGTITFYRNDRNPREPDWSQPSHYYNGIQLGCGSAPVPIFADIDNDDDLDLFIGQSNGTIIFYHNIGTPNAPEWLWITNFYANIDVGAHSFLAFADIDGDEDLDLFIGGHPSAGGQPEIYFYENTGTTENADWVDRGPYRNINTTFKFGNTAWPAPVFVDIDNDGDQDMFIGINSAAS